MTLITILVTLITFQETLIINDSNGGTMTLTALIVNVIIHLMIYCDPDNSACVSNNTNSDSNYFNDFW